MAHLHNLTRLSVEHRYAYAELERFSQLLTMVVQRSKRLVASSVLLASVVLTATGCGSAHMSDDRAGRAQRSTVQVTGGTVEEQRAVRESLSGLPQAPIVDVTIGKVPTDFGPSDANWISIDASVADVRDVSEADWYALMLAGAFRAKSAALGLTPVLGKTINVRLTDGTLVDSASSTIEQPSVPPIAPQADTVTRGIVDEAAASAGLSVQSFDFVRPERDGIVVSLVAKDRPSVEQWRKRFLTAVLAKLAAPERAHVEGTLIKVFDDSGNLVAVSGYSVRTGEGVGWTDPKYGVNLHI
jgi:hypothetical protein